MAPHLSRVWQTLHDDWQAKSEQIERLGQDEAEILVKMPDILFGGSGS